MKQIVKYTLVLMAVSIQCFAQAQSNTPKTAADTMDMVKKMVIVGATPRGVGVIGAPHLFHPETTHKKMWRGFNVYRQDAPSTAFKKLNNEPIAAPLSSEGLLEALGVVRYERLIKEQGLKDEAELLDKIRSGDESLAFLAVMFNRSLVEPLGMIFYDTTAQKGKTYQYFTTKIRKDFSEGDLSDTISFVFEYPSRKPPVLKSVKQEDRIINDSTAYTRMKQKDEERQKRKAKQKGERNINNLVIGDSLSKSMIIPDTVSYMRQPVYKTVAVEILPNFTADNFYILRGTDSTGSFLPIHPLPFKVGGTPENPSPIVVKDTSLNNNMTYYYTAASEDEWGNRKYSDTVKVLITPPLPPIPQELNAETTADGIKLDWEKLEYLYLSGFNLYQKINEEPDTIIAEKVNTQLIPVDATTFTMTKAKPGKTYLFYLVTVDNFGQESKYSAGVKMIYENKRPPLPPLGVQARPNPDKKSITISWQANEEEDLDGYSVLRSTSIKGVPATITEIILPKEQTSFVDTSSSIHPNMDFYYFLQANNKTGYQSPLSQYAVVRIVEKIAPKRINSLVGKGDALQGNLLSWDAPIDENVEVVRLYKGLDPKTKPMLIYEERVSNGKFSFRDKNIEAGVEYQYFLRAVSMDSLESDNSDPVTLFITPEQLEAPDRLSIAPQTDGSLLLKWVPNFQDGLAGFHVYRISYKGGKKKLSQTMIPKGTNTYLDKDIQKDEIYYYFVRSVDGKGFEGLDSEQVKFEMITPEK